MTYVACQSPPRNSLEHTLPGVGVCFVTELFARVEGTSFRKKRPFFAFDGARFGKRRLDVIRKRGQETAGGQENNGRNNSFRSEGQFVS